MEFTLIILGGLLVMFLFEFYNKRGLRRARKVVSDEKLIRIINAANRFTSLEHGQVIAVGCVLGSLDRGSTLDDIFSSFRYSLSVTKRNELEFSLHLGYQAGPLAGDSGWWNVSFDELGNVKQIILVSKTIS